MLKMIKRICAALLLTTTINSGNAMACSSCGCSFNSDWASEGYTNCSGLRLDARFSYINQNEIRYGSNSVTKSSFSFPNEMEVQQHTLTRETLLGADYSPSKAWGLHLALPLLNRTHSTVMEGESETTHSSTQGLGDLSLVARYQGFSPLAKLGIQAGLKLPTGKFTDTFKSGPMSDERLDRGLQNGTGTTDGILGFYYFDNLNTKVGYFAHVLGAQPVDQREGFRTGVSVVTSTGISYRATSVVQPQLQLNYKYESREEGSNADHQNSGGHYLALTPGVDLAINSNLDIYTLVQVPLYQEVNGYQIQPQAILSLGARWTF